MKKTTVGVPLHSFHYIVSNDINEPLLYIDSFIITVKKLVTLVGLQNFMKAMGWTTTSYYRRIDNPNTWTIGELKLCVAYFKEQKLIK